MPYNQGKKREIKLNKMKQEKINYDKIMSLGFTEEICSDDVYYAQHGYKYAIITKHLTKKIYLDWQKDTKLCEMVRLDSPNTGHIKARLPIMNLQQVKDLITFFSNDRKQLYDASSCA